MDAVKSNSTIPILPARHLNRDSARNAPPKIAPHTSSTFPSKCIDNTKVVLNTRLHEFRHIDTSARLRSLERYTTGSIQVQHPALAIVDPGWPSQVAQPWRTRWLRGLDESAPNLPEDGRELGWLVGCRRTKVRGHI